MDVRMPDGTVITNVPEGTTRSQLMARYEKSKRLAALPQSMANIEADQASYNPTSGMSGSDLRVAGMGKVFADLGRGAGQLLGVTSNEDVRESRVLDAPLMATTAGKVGNFAGNVAVAAPAAFVPGVNTVAGAGLTGATLGLLQPAESAEERVKNTALGGTLGAVGQKVGQVVGNKVGAAIAGRATRAADTESANAVRDATLAEARRAGYVVPPATSNPNVTNRVIESVSGKAATQQSAMVRNQQVTNRLVREELGLPKGAPLNNATLNGLRTRAGNVYKALKAAGDVTTDQQYLDEVVNLTRSADEIAQSFAPSAQHGMQHGLSLAGHAEIQALQDTLMQPRFGSNAAVELVKKLRHEASANLKWNVEDPAKKALGLAQREAAGIVEDQLIRHLQATGRGALADQFDAARKLIAKTYSVQAALNEGSGNVVATKLSALLRKGKPLSGNLELAARFGQAFPKAAGEQTTSAGVSAVDALLAGGLGSTVDPTLFGLPLARIAARGTILSKPYQAAMATPGYSANNGFLQMLERTAPLSAPVAIGIGNTE